MTHVTGPVDARGRLAELDAIRGFALFGVLWMNLYEHAGLAIPPEAVMRLAPDAVETAVDFAGKWLMIGKAQALFSILFGFGFALFLDRAERAGADGRRLYLRRLGVLLVLGIAHALLLWAGDILHSYALVGFALVLTRRWPGWLLLTVGLACACGAIPATTAVVTWLHPGQPLSWDVLEAAGAVRREGIFMGHDYPRYVAELARLWWEFYTTPIGPAFLVMVFGRFLIGQWLFRQGWLQSAATRAPQVRRWAALLLAGGLAMTLVRPVQTALGIGPTGLWSVALQVDQRVGQIVLALGYAAVIVALCRSEAWRRRLAGLAAAGQMALTNYLTQSLVYFFVLYGFGLALLPYAAPAAMLALALAVYAAQIGFSRWWLARHRFGPAEWVWRNLTYGVRHPLRHAAPGAAAALPG